MEQNHTHNEIALKVIGATKSFGGVTVLDHVDFTLYKGEVNVLMGENGAGKSTLIKIISGAYIPNAGSIELDGEPLVVVQPIEALEKGISVVYQELNLIETLSAYENIFTIDQLVKKKGPVKILDRQAMIRQSRELLDMIGAHFDVTIPVKNLSVAQRQMVEIAKALRMDSKVIILDEPSAVLTDLEVEKIMKGLYISMNKDFKNLKLFIGIGKRVNNLKLLYKGYEEAKNVAKINRLISNNKVHIRYSEMAIYRLLLEIENKEIIKEFHDQTIGDLVVYDKVNNTDYVELLESYFENNCKINDTAKSLYLHRNTVNYKISKIEEILDINLDDIGDKSKIYLSLMIRYLL